MTIDKMKHYLPNYIFEFWTNCRDIDAMIIAKELLKKELSQGLLNGYKYEIELQLLQYLTNQKLNLQANF